MAAEQGAGSDMSRQRLTIDNDVYELVSTAAISREQRSRVAKYNDPELKYMKAYKFDRLHSMRRRIRLLRLHGGGLSNPEITCELFEVEYDKDDLNVVRKVYSDSEHLSHKPRRRKYTSSAHAQPEQTYEPTNEDHTGRESAEHDDTVEYEALSWCWGTENKDCAIRVKKDGDYYRLAVTKELSLALKYLRHADGDRILWIDALCINQENHEERNHQVQMMSRIYTGAKQACIWLGEDNDDSTKAIHFIREIMRLENFDSISEKKENASKWQSLLLLMQRPWFSRRWVVQEIALAKSATIHCGSDQIPWENFAVAVELFVEVETATHRLSEVMRKDEKFGHVPQWFEHVSELGASVLVQATGKVFRRDGLHRVVSKEDTTSNVQGRHHSPKSRPHKRTGGHPDPSKSSDRSPQRPLLSLEYLVSSLTVFEASQPRDAVYSLLAIARDTAPLAELQTVSTDGTEEAIIMSTVSSFLERKPFKVDYSRAYSDVCKDFISSCIEKSGRSDPTRALDILCRPWAPEADETPGNVVHKKPVAYKFLPHREHLWRGKRDGQKSRLCESYGYNPNDIIMRITNPEERIGAPTRRLKADDRSMEDYWKDCDEVWKQNGHDSFVKRVLRYLPEKPRPPKERKENSYQDDYTSDDSKESEDEQDDPDQDIELPSWVSRISGASFALYRLPGMNRGGRIGRQNADPLVGSPQEGHKNYSAAQNTKVEFRSDRRLRFRKRPGSRDKPASGHCSLYTEGFILAEVETVAEPARLGGIPKTWTQIAGWDHAVDGETEPPAEFWRTLVADRGKDNRNPPYYYATACKESVRKGGLRGGSVDTGALISSERNSIIAEFCRRVQAVIWNRRLIRTGGPPKAPKVLGLASEHVSRGDLVCILSGCTVPVILRPYQKAEEDLEVERMQDSIESMKAALSICEEACFRKNRYRKRLHMERKKDRELEETWKREVKEELKEVNQQIEELRDQEKRMKEEKLRRDREQKKRKSEADQRLALAKRARKEAEANAGRRSQFPLRAATTMPIPGSSPMADGSPVMQPADETAARRIGAADLPGQANGGMNSGPVQSTQQSSHAEDSQGQDGSPASGCKTNEQVDKDEEEKQRQEAKDKAKEEDPKRWYKFIGEAYIHGMMDGEAVRLQINEGLPMRMFEIR